MTDGARSEWADFLLHDFSLIDFAPGSRVLDVGCGRGEQLEALRRAGFDAVGVEPSAHLVEELTHRGFTVVRGVAERLPVEPNAFDGLLCKVVVPYTDERLAIAEWARVVRPGGSVRAIYHGAGYYLRYLTEGPGLAYRAYGMRSILNTWCYALTRRRLPGFLGDTLYQSTDRLVRYYRASGFSLERERPSPRFKGKSVFIYHELRRLDDQRR